MQGSIMTGQQFRIDLIEYAWPLPGDELLSSGKALQEGAFVLYLRIHPASYECETLASI